MPDMPETLDYDVLAAITGGGETASEAFFVRCDRTTMTQSDSAPKTATVRAVQILK